jgi:hypothetical protein
MTPDADMAAAPDPRIAAAEMWLCMVGALREIARRFSRFLVHEIMPFGPGPKAPYLAFRFRGDPVAAMKRVTRIARFAAILAMKIEQQIAAWRAGAPFDLEAFISQAPRVSARAKSGADALDDDEDAWEDLDEWENFDERESPERFDVFGEFERPVKEDKYQALLRGPLKDAIAAICKELGLKPDWSLWTAKGFPPPADGAVEDWVAFFVPEAAAAPPPPHDRDRTRRPTWPPPIRHPRFAPLYAAATRPRDRGGSP